MKKQFKKILLKCLTVVPIASIAFAAQAAPDVKYEGGEKSPKVEGKSLYIDGLEYDLNRIWKAPSGELVEDIPVEMIRKYYFHIQQGKVRGVKIGPSSGVMKEGGSVSRV